MDNTARARFLTSLGSLNDYGSTIYQTKQALDEGTTSALRQNTDDIAIFTDAQRGIEAIKQIGFSTEGIIAINRAFTSASDEEPAIPGHLRNATYNEDDRITVLIDGNARNGYFPPEQVSRKDLDAIVIQYNNSKHTESDAWCVFADLAKLQPFQDGNKRTALIAANAAYGSLTSGDYLTLPFDDLDRVDFTVGLMRYYQATDINSQEAAFARMLSLLPSTTERKLHLHAPIAADEPKNGKTKRVKTQLRNKRV